MHNPNSNVLDVDVNNLSQMQYDFLKDKAIERLRGIIDLLEQDKPDKVEALLVCFTREGGDEGVDSYYCIDFSYLHDDLIDIYSVCYKLMSIKRHILDL